MHFKQHEVGEFRIYTAATPAFGGGFTAAVSVMRRLPKAGAPDEIHTDLSLSNGFEFREPSAALQHAFDVAYRVIRRQNAPAAHSGVTS